MRHYVAFLKKELLESLRTYKLFIMLTVFTLFGVMNPLVAKLTPYLMENLIPAGNKITIPEPTAMDSWAQFFKNINQMGMIVMILVFGGILASELSKGTLINVLTKGLSRTAVILAKFTSMILIWTVSMAVSFIVTWLYTIYLFPTGGISHLFFAMMCLWLYGLFLLSVLMFSSTITNTSYGSLIIVGLTVVSCTVLNLVPKVQKFNPLTLSLKNMELLSDTLSFSYLNYTIVVTISLIVLLITSAIFIFKRKQI